MVELSALSTPSGLLSTVGHSDIDEATRELVWLRNTLGTQLVRTRELV